ncbi:cation transporter [Salipaludibacillus keqinensis]|uniref:Cation transporter n=1 Tax=Salipaludibacillus keqinensis TaxID=2045207 RepID=A0A323THU3_9BACI|nr:cation diffusion facilitator family transporter [Salipaludibacillus keqinensis]PYZ92203.1 cation transporter [Salipaludibacillus keqinensis]
MVQKLNKDKKVLMASVYAAIAFSVAGIVLGTLFQSQMILFDGLYSLISVALSLLSLTAATFMSKNDWRRFPFGKDMIEPLVITFKYAIILILVIGSLIMAIVSIFQGGRDVAVGAALIYAATSTFACLVIYRYLNKHASQSKTGFISAESNQWLMDTLVSAGVLVGFVLAAILQYIPSMQALVPYIDPLMVVIVSIYFIKVPLIEIRHSMREVLEMTPEEELTRKIETVIYDVESKYDMQETILRISKVGRTLSIEVDFIVKKTSKVQSISDQDHIREEISTKIHHIDYTKWLTVSFTNDRKWAV